MSSTLFHLHPGLRWSVLAGLSVVLAGVFSAAHLPAAVLLACMLCAVALSLCQIRLAMPPLVFALAQGVLGCLIARSLQVSVLARVARDWPMFLGFALAVIGVSAALGWLMMRRRVFPGSTAVWGLMPGGASAMVLMSGEFGADARLVAFMQYLRVVIVTALASVVAWLWAPQTGPAATLPWLAMGAPSAMGWTLALAVGGALLGRRLDIPAGPLLLPMALATLLQGIGALSLDLPQPLLALAYSVIGWSIGLRFTLAILQHAWRTLPSVLASILVLVALGLLLALALHRMGGFEPLTAYLATSPGGADSVAVIAATSAVDAGFVMAMQVARLLMVVACGPRVSRWVSS